MNRARKLRVPGVVSLLLVLVLILTSVADAAPPAVGNGSAAASSGIGEGVEAPPPVLHRASPGAAGASIPVQRVQGEPQAVQLSTFSVYYLDPGTVWRGYTCQAWPLEAKTAFDYATTIWGSRIKSSVPIEVEACWTPFADPDVIGAAWPTWYWRDFTGAPVAQTWYPNALADALHGSNGDTTRRDIYAVFGSTFPWYFGTSGTPGPGQYDFVTAVARELGYGLGYENTMWIDNGGLGHWGWYTEGDPAKIMYPDVYDRLVVNGAGQSLVTGFANPSAALAAQIQSNNVFFDGAQAKAANGGKRPWLYAPNHGSDWSISYLESFYDGTPNALMTYTLAPQEVVHDPGPMGLAILNDLGWKSPPTVTGFSPASGNVGASVAINGTNLSEATTVSFNGVSASVTNFSAAAVIATVPVGASTGPVTVTTSYGTGTSTASFNVTLTKPPQVTLLPSPARVVDTRVRSGYQGLAQPMLGSPTPRTFKLAGEGGVPANASAVLVNLTAASIPADGWISAWPACKPWPGTSSLNFDTVENAIANFAVVKLGVAADGAGCQGKINVTGLKNANVIVDVVGYLVTTTEDQLVLLDTPQRMVDTRPNSGKLGAGTPIPANPGYSLFELAPQAWGATVLANLTAVDYKSNGWVAAYPSCAGGWPGTSNLNFDTDENAIANFAMVKLGFGEKNCGGSMDVTASSSTDFIVDVVGYITPMETGQISFLPSPQRVVDTRQAADAPALQGGTVRCFQIGGQKGVPADAQGVIMNLTGVGYTRDGWIAAYPSGETWTGTSSLNFDTQENAIANTAVVKLGADGKVCLLASSNTHAIIDVAGYLGATAATQRVSVSASGVEADGDSSLSAISEDGRFVAFQSAATNLVSGDTNNQYDIFVKDRQTGAVERVSVASDGTQANGNSSNPAISADGRFVAFVSGATNLVEGDTNGAVDTFVKDRLTGALTRASVSAEGTQGNGSFDSSTALSADGRFVAFQAHDSAMVPGDTNGRDDVFVKDLQTGTIEIVSAAADGTPANGEAFGGTLSADGRYVAFRSAASNLVPGDTNGVTDTFVRDRQAGTVERVSVTADGAQASDATSAGPISADGRYVCFEAHDANLVPGDTNLWNDVFVKDRQTGAIERVSVSAGGAQGNANSGGCSMSPDGRFVAFHSEATNFVPGATHTSIYKDVFVKDRQTGIIEKVSVSTAGTEASYDSYALSISAGGHAVVFCSLANNLVAADTNYRMDVFVTRVLP